MLGAFGLAGMAAPAAAGNEPEAQEIPAAQPAASIDIEKSPDRQDVEVGGTARWQITVTNTGGLDLAGVEVTDAPAPGCASAIGALAVGDSVTYDCELPGVLESFTNTATANGLADAGATMVSDTADALVEVFAIGDPLVIDAPAGSAVSPATDTLPRTGSETAVLLALSPVLLAAGALILVSERRRQARPIRNPLVSGRPRFGPSTSPH